MSNGCPTEEKVPCNGCRLCCQNDAIILHPDLGDDVSSYETVPITHPLTGDDAVMLAHKQNGDCIYLGDYGCKIYDRRPVICREYDCRRQYLTMTRKERAAIVAQGMASEAQFEAGKARLATLPGQDRLQIIAKRKQRVGT